MKSAEVCLPYTPVPPKWQRSMVTLVGTASEPVPSFGVWPGSVPTDLKTRIEHNIGSQARTKQHPVSPGTKQEHGAWWVAQSLINAREMGQNDVKAAAHDPAVARLDEVAVYDGGVVDRTRQRDGIATELREGAASDFDVVGRAELDRTLGQNRPVARRRHGVLLPNEHCRGVGKHQPGLGGGGGGGFAPNRQVSTEFARGARVQE